MKRNFKLDWVDTSKTRYVEYFSNCYSSFFEGNGILNPTLKDFPDDIYKFGIIFKEDGSVLMGTDLAKIAINQFNLKKSKFYKPPMKEFEWLYEKYNTEDIIRIGFELIYNYVSDVSSDEIVDVEVFYKYVENEMDSIIKNAMSKTRVFYNDPILGTNAIRSVCKALSNIICLPIDLDEWWINKQCEHK